MTGKRVRLGRITDRDTGNAVIVPMDHGVTMGPVNGLTNVSDTVGQVADGGATAVLMQKGLIPYAYRPRGKDIGLIMHISASTEMSSDRNNKVLVSTVTEAIRCGADAVSMHVNFGNDNEGRMLSDLGKVSKECTEWGMPLMVMAYPSDRDDMYNSDKIAHCARAVSELGADIVKVAYTGDERSFRKVVEGALAPVVIAGGPKMSSDKDILKMVQDSMKAGGRGVSIGRNIFQHSNITAMTQAISDIVIGGVSAEQAYKCLR